MTAARRRPALLAPGLTRAILGALLGFAVGGGLVAFVLEARRVRSLPRPISSDFSASCSASARSASG